MTRDVVTASEEESLHTVALDMERGRLRHVPVVSGRRLVGLLSHRDILRYTTSDLETSSLSRNQARRIGEETFVGSVMTTGVTTISPDGQVAEAVRLLRENRFGCLPVVDGDGVLVGIVTEHDLLGELARMLDAAV